MTARIDGPADGGAAKTIAEHLSDAERLAFWKYEFDLAIAQIRKRDADWLAARKAP